MPAKTLLWLAATRKMQTAKANVRKAMNAPAHGMKTAANAGATGAASAEARAARTVMHRRMAKPPFQNQCSHRPPRKQK
jgi:uncharacterized protein involved in copper resistance